MAQYPKYEISAQRLTGIADQARRLGKVSGKLTPGQIQDTLAGVGLLSNAEETTFGGDEENAEYIIQGKTLTGIADQVQRLGRTDSLLTPAAMEAVLQGVKIGGELYNAEEYTFGAQDETTEYAVTNIKGFSRSNNDVTYSAGWKFEVLSAVSVRGFRMKNSNYSSYTNFTAKLYRVSDSELIASASMVCARDATVDVFLDAPVNLTVGETYVVYVRNNYWNYASITNVTVNSKIGFVNGILIKSDIVSDILATSEQLNEITGFIFPIIGDPINAGIPTEFKVQLTTMNEIANEIQRITGTAVKMSTTEIINALQGIEATA